MFRSKREPSVSEAAAPAPTPIHLDLNFLPDRYRGRGRRTLVTLRPWLFLLSFALLLIPSGQLFVQRTEDLARVEGELSVVSEAREGYQPLVDERAALEARIRSAESQIVVIQAAYDTVNIQRVTWSDLVPDILGQAPDGVHITLVDQADFEIVLEGLAEAYPWPSTFVDRLDSLGEFESVTIQSVVRLTPEEELAIVEPSEGEAEEAEETVEPKPERPFLYRFSISLLLPLPVEPVAQTAEGG